MIRAENLIGVEMPVDIGPFQFDSTQQMIGPTCLPLSLPNSEWPRILDVKGWSTPAELIALYLLARSRTHGDFVELGTYHGRSASVLALACKHRGAGRVYCVDRFRQRNATLDATTRNLDTLGLARFARLISQSHERPLFVDATFTLAFFDGTHTFESLEQSMRAIASRLTPDAIITIHDYRHHRFPEVTEFCDNTFSESGRVDHLFISRMNCRRGT